MIVSVRFLCAERAFLIGGHSMTVDVCQEPRVCPMPHGR
jgi:hypothetical protein